MKAAHTALDAATLEVLRNALDAIAEEMGAVLRRTSFSPNIKERADCSAAVFDPAGEMVAQAEHIPVHLGSMPASVRAVLDAFGELAPGMQVCLNDPYMGGTHLPDLTIVAAVGNMFETPIAAIPFYLISGVCIGLPLARRGGAHA